MCGGAGTRLWPVSRQASPKQYHALVSEHTMLEDTILRVSQAKDIAIAPPSFVSAKDHEGLIRSQCESLGVSPHYMVLEPFGRNTAPVAAIVSDIIAKHDDDALILLLPADHYIEDPEEFWAKIDDGIQAAGSGNLMTLGIHPTSPHTGYGYIKRGEAIGKNTYKVDTFVEKPDLKRAKTYLAQGDYFWNAGIFLFAPNTMINAFKAYAPDILKSCQDTLAKTPQDNKTLKLDPDCFSKCPSESIDYAIMEHARNVGLIAPVDIGWNDIGSWSALYDLTKSGDSNAIAGEAIAIDCTNSILRSSGPLIAGVGLEDFIVVATQDAVLVMPKDRAQDVKTVIAEIKDKKLTDLL